MTRRRIVVCLDGTWKSAYDPSERSDGHKVLKPSNVLKLCRAVRPRAADGTEQIAYYDVGVGSLAEYPGPSNRLLYHSDRVLGGSWGAGFEGNVEDALSFLALNHREGDEIFLFGFSRGAATARAVSQFLDWAGGLPAKSDAYYLPVFFREYVVHHGERSSDDVAREINANRDREREGKGLPHLLPFQKVDIAYLGVWDTVMALGSRFRDQGASTSVASRSFYLREHPSRCARSARQALAIDEKRYDFRPEIWTRAVDGQSLEQRWFAGVHSNVGGGYADDGLANIAFHWILNGAKTSGLEVDDRFAGAYRKFPMDRLYDSQSTLYRVLDAVRFRVGRGKRSLVDHPGSAHLSLDKSVIHRLNADPAEFPDMDGKRYRPENVLRLLAAEPDLDGYLEGLGLADDQRRLPEDVRRQVEKLRR